MYDGHTWYYIAVGIKSALTSNVSVMHTVGPDSDIIYKPNHDIETTRVSTETKDNRKNISDIITFKCDILSAVRKIDIIFSFKYIQIFFFYFTLQEVWEMWGREGGQQMPGRTSGCECDLEEILWTFWETLWKSWMRRLMSACHGWILVFLWSVTFNHLVIVTLTTTIVSDSSDFCA